MGNEAERCAADRAGDDQRRRVEMGVAFGAGPDRRERHHVSEIEGRDQRLPHVGIGVARDGGQPRLRCVQGFRNGDETPAPDNAFDRLQLLVGEVRTFVHHRDGRRDISIGNGVRAQLLQRLVGIVRLVGGVGVDQRNLLLEDCLAQQRDDALALGEPLPANLGQFAFRFRLVE